MITTGSHPNWGRYLANLLNLTAAILFVGGKLKVTTSTFFFLFSASIVTLLWLLFVLTLLLLVMHHSNLATSNTINHFPGVRIVLGILLQYYGFNIMLLRRAYKTKAITRETEAIRFQVSVLSLT